MKPKSLEEAQNILDEYPTEESFIDSNYTAWLRDGEFCDNSIDLSFYYKDCLELAAQSQNTKSH